MMQRKTSNITPPHSPRADTVLRLIVVLSNTVATTTTLLLELHRLAGSATHDSLTVLLSAVVCHGRTIPFIVRGVNKKFIAPP